MNIKTHQNGCPQIQLTRLQPPFFSTGLWHFGQGFVFTVIQFIVSDSSLHFLVQSSHIRHEQGECASDEQLKQNWCPQAHSTSQNSSSSTRNAFPQWGTLGHHFTNLLSSIYDSRRKRSKRSAKSGSLELTRFLTTASSQTALHLYAMHLMRLLCPSLIFTIKCSVQPIYKSPYIKSIRSYNMLTIDWSQSIKIVLYLTAY